MIARCMTMKLKKTINRGSDDPDNDDIDTITCIDPI